MIHNGSQNQQLPTYGQISDITPDVMGDPNVLEWGTNSTIAHKWANWLHNTCHLGVPNASDQKTKSALTRKWAHWPHSMCRLGGPEHFTARNNIRSGTPMGNLAT